MLSHKRRVFVNEYLKCWNASEAARRAGYSEKTAGSQGYDLLKIPEISAEIQRHVTESAMSADELLVRLSELARADITEFFDVSDDQPQLALARALRAGRGRLIKKIKLRPNGAVDFELVDVYPALTLLAKIHGLAKESVELSTEIPIRVVDYRNGLAAVAPGSDEDSG